MVTLDANLLSSKEIPICQAHKHILGEPDILLGKPVIFAESFQVCIIKWEDIKIT
jgi:hypothetical protein